MANFFQHQDRRVIPNWRSFTKTVALGELGAISPVPSPPVSISIDQYLQDWEFTPAIVSAAELVAAALVACQVKDPRIKEAAEFLIANRTVATPTQIAIAERIVEGEASPSPFRLESITAADLASLTNPKLIGERIRLLRHALKEFPENAVAWVEFSRSYSTLGHTEQALRAMKNAVQLAPHNRFVVRSAVRLFAHYEELDHAQYVIVKSQLLKKDPWILSADIALSTLRNRHSKNLRLGLTLVENENLSPFHRTELASALATVELLNGTLKKSRKLFEQALLAPNDNSLAQVEWALRKEPLIGLNVGRATSQHSFEANAFEAFQQGDYQLALDQTSRWFLDMPFSKRSVLFGSHIASSLLDRGDLSMDFLKAGLVAHPNDPQLINNLAYALALNNQPGKALEYLNRVATTFNIAKTTAICIKATRGLAYFRNGLPEEGRRLYLEAMTESRDLKLEYFNWLALLNLAREEVLIKSSHASEAMAAVALIPDNDRHEDLTKLKKEVNKLYQNLQLI